MLLSELETGKSAVIIKVKGHGAFRKRISEMGFIKGQKVSVVKNAPLQDPVQYSLMGYEITLRKAEASLIEVNDGIAPVEKPEYFGTHEYTFENLNTHVSENTINVALVGNPNSGKTSVFNAASRSTEHVGNYGGVTIDTKLARIKFQGYIFNLYDLPGTYSLSSFSPEEVFVRNFISQQVPDIILNVVDVTNLERNLFLTTQLVDLNQRMVIALNMFDEFRKGEDRFDYQSFSRLLGIPVIPTVGSKGKGLAQLFNAIIDKYNESEVDRKRIHIHYGQDVEKAIESVRTEIFQPENFHITARQCARFIAVKLLEGDQEADQLINGCVNPGKIRSKADSQRQSLRILYGEPAENLITDSRYGFISGALKETYSYGTGQKHRKSEKIDRVLTHKYLGIPLFFAFLWIMFVTTFKAGQFPMNWIEQFISWLSVETTGLIPAGDFQSLLTEGILGGVGGVIVFLPNIMILFLFISFFEDSGYMARAAFIMDRVMHKIGLHGKSFIPLIMGFGCNVPAILSTRIIESRNNRILTMLILPFMSCSARLPVYILIISAFFPNYQGTVLFGIYLTGIALAVITALIFRKMFFNKADSPFVMELPPYRMPTFRNVFRHMWNKSYQYLQKIGGIILVASVIIWGLNYYPNKSKLMAPGNKTELQLSGIQSSGEKPEYSYLESFGRFVQPVMEPLGFDWKMTVSILAGIPGKEVVVSTMGVLYEDDEIDSGLQERIKQDIHTEGKRSGQKVFNPAVALGFLIFILIYFPCIAVIATIAKESGSLSWSILTILYTSILAWVMAFLVYHLAGLIIGL